MKDPYSSMAMGMAVGIGLGAVIGAAIAALRGFAGAHPCPSFRALKPVADLCLAGR